MSSTRFFLFALLAVVLSMQAYFVYKIEQLPSDKVTRYYGLPLATKSGTPSCSSKEGTATIGRSSKSNTTGNRFSKLPPWPNKLDEVWKDEKIVRNPQFLLDFAIIGTEKSGTSTLMKWLGAHQQVKCFQREIYDLFHERPDMLMWSIIELMPPTEGGDNVKRGYKSPLDIFNIQAFYLLDKFWPETKLILTLRHPVLQFESLFNFRIQNLNTIRKTLAFYDPSTDAAFDTKCVKNPNGVCTDRSNFGQYLYQFGKTLGLPNYPTNTEKSILEGLKRDHPSVVPKIQYFRNKMFIIEMGQLSDENKDRKLQLAVDLSEYLGLDHPLDPTAPHAKPGKKWDRSMQAAKDSRKIDICEEKYLRLRTELMRISRTTATWLEESFLKSPDVYVSSKDYFLELLQEWQVDPCDNRKKKQHLSFFGALGY